MSVIEAGYIGNEAEVNLSGLSLIIVEGLAKFSNIAVLDLSNNKISNISVSKPIDLSRHPSSLATTTSLPNFWLNHMTMSLFYLFL